MAHIEIQISQGSFTKAIIQQLAPLVYGQCFLSPSPTVLLDHLSIVSVGPATPVTGNSPHLTVPVVFSASLVTQSDVVAAAGGAATPVATPQWTVALSVSIQTTTLTTAYAGVTDDSQIYSLLLAAGESPADAQTARDQFVAQISQAFGGATQSFDFSSALPSLIQSLSLGRTALSADAACIAVRLEVGARTTDGDWTAFLSGTLTDYIQQGSDWGIYIDSAIIVDTINQELAAQGPLNDISSSWTGAQTPTVVSTAYVRAHAIVVVHVDLQATTVFTMPTPGTLHAVATIKIVGGVAGYIEKSVASLLGLPNGGQKSLDFLIPPIGFGTALTLRSNAVLGLPTGMWISGIATVAAGLQPPVCTVDVKPFLLQYIKSCSAIRDHVQRPATPDSVSVIATFDVGDSDPQTQFPLVIGKIILVSDDPQLQFTSFIPAVPSSPATDWSFQIQIPLNEIKSGYKNAPYPCQLLILTSGGARSISLGEIPIPMIDPMTGLVTNVQTIYVQDCHLVDIDPWVVMTAVFNPRWLIDPGPEGEAERIETVVRELMVLLAKEQAGKTAVISIAGRQVATAAIGRVAAAIRSNKGIAGDQAEREAVSVFLNAARLQPPALRGANANIR